MNICWLFPVSGDIFVPPAIGKGLLKKASVHLPEVFSASQKKQPLGKN